MTVHVRAATAADRDFIVGMVPRLRAFGPPPLRHADALDRAEVESLEHALVGSTADATLLVAELDGIGPAGVAHAVTVTDYFTQELHGHLSFIAVSEADEGRGVGRALLAAVDAWAAGRGYRFVALDVLAGNQRARAVYARAGYTEDIVRYVKELPPPS